MRKRTALILFLALAALLLPQAGRAQTEILLDRLEVNLWPEYDRPEMLVFYKVTLQAETELGPVTFRIPKEAGEPYKVALWAEDGNLYETTYTFRAGSEWGEVTFDAHDSNFQIEYYDPRLDKQGSRRTFDFAWPGDYDIASASIVVQQPHDASQMTFNLENVTSFLGVDNLTYREVQIGQLVKGQPFDFSLTYEKASNTLTYPGQQVHPAGKLPESMWNRRLLWALGVLAVLLIAGGVLVYWRLGQPQAGEKQQQRWKVAVLANGEAADDSGVYCHRCGRRGALNDLFCRSCGTKLRI